MNMSPSQHDCADEAGLPMHNEEAFQTLLASQQARLQHPSKPLDALIPGGDSVAGLLNHLPHHQDASVFGQSMSPSLQLGQSKPLPAMQFGSNGGEPNLSLNMIGDSLLNGESNSQHRNFLGSGAGRRMQRRRSTLQFLRYVFEQNNPGITSAQGAQVPGQPQPIYNSHNMLNPSQSDHTSSDALEPLSDRKTSGAVDYKSRLTLLKIAMEKAQKSQQDIHDWDRKMGLKKSHSKTMRLTRRSRKKILKFLSKEINAIKRSRK